MTKSTLSETDILRSRLNQETARLPFTELLRHFAAGHVVKVSNTLDLVEVAVQFAQNNKKQVAHWLNIDEVMLADDADAARWQEEQQELWAVVVSPWILVQEDKPQHLKPQHQGHVLH